MYVFRPFKGAPFPDWNVLFLEIVWPGKEQRHLLPKPRGPIGTQLRLVRLDASLENNCTHLMVLLSGSNESLYVVFSPGLCVPWEYGCGRPSAGTVYTEVNMAQASQSGKAEPLKHKIALQCMKVLDKKHVQGHSESIVWWGMWMTTV